MKKILNRLKVIKEQKGAYAIEAAISMMLVLMVTFLGISYFTYLLPRQALTQEVHTLAQTAKIQGGLTTEITEPGNSDIERFKTRMKARGYDPDEITIEAKATSTDEFGTEHQRSVLGVESLSVGYLDISAYSHRNSKEIIIVHVTVPAKKNFVNAMSQFFGGKDSTLTDYEFSEIIMSERW